MKWLMQCLTFLGLSLPLLGWGSPFTVLVYNVENLFDIDGVAAFDQYQLSDEAYGVEPLIRKMENIRQTLAVFNGGDGPEVILFQEFELDRTPFGTPDAQAFLEATAGMSLEDLLEEDDAFFNLPAELLLLKYLADAGMAGYAVAQPDPVRSESHPAHKNVVFSKFPITYVKQRPSHDARDLLEVGLSIDGHPLVVLNNHWKSGASNASTEAIRVQNARVVRARLEAILLEDPEADVIIAGDFNAYYNHRAVFPDLPETAVNDVLGALGNEADMLEGSGWRLYNLWFELPPEQRGSEVWRGKWGTLMQMVLTPGLYDGEGIQYIDNSFNRVILPGLNVGERWGRPTAWSNIGGGTGFSDHLPIYARFRIAPDVDPERVFSDLENQAMTAFQPTVNYARLDRRALPELDRLASTPYDEWEHFMGELFHVRATVTGTRPLRIRVADREISFFSPEREIRNQLDSLAPGDIIQTKAELDDWRGNVQFVIQHPSWLD